MVVLAWEGRCGGFPFHFPLFVVVVSVFSSRSEISSLQLLDAVHGATIADPPYLPRAIGRVAIYSAKLFFAERLTAPVRLLLQCLPLVVCTASCIGIDSSHTG